MPKQGSGQGKGTGGETERCREILEDLAVVLKALNIYPGPNRALHNLFLKLHEKLRSFLDEHGEMRLQAVESSLFYKSEEVYTGLGKSNMARMLSSAGIRELVFRKGLEKEELETLAHALKRYSLRKNKNPQDLVALLWREELRHIGYSMPGDFFAEKEKGKTGFCPGAATGQEKENFFAVRGERGIADIVFEAFKSGLDSLPLNPDELEVLKGGFYSMEMALLGEFITDILLKLIQNAVDEASAPVYSKILCMLARGLIEKNDSRGTLELLKKICALSGGGQSARDPLYLSRPGGSVIGGVLGELSSLETARWFLKASGSRVETEKYLFLISPFGVETLLDLLAESQDRRTRKIICNILAFMAPRNLQEIAWRLSDERWYVVRNIVSVLGMSGSRHAAGFVKQASSHPSVKVRRECVKAFEALPAAGTYAALLELLSDDDSGVRTKAAKALARKFFGTAGLFGVLEKIASGSGFPVRPFEEKREFLEVYGLLGGERSFPLLKDAFSRRLMVWHDQDELRAASAFGLAHVPLAEAAILLERGARSRTGLLRESCLAAIEMRKKKFTYSPRMDVVLGATATEGRPSSSKIS